MAITASTSLNVTIAHAIAYLTRPLILSYPATTVIKLQLILEANLTALYAPSWVPQEPLRGSGRRCLTLSPHCLPPRAVYSACLSAGVQWFDWISVLGGREFDFFVDPACISVRYGKKATTPLFTVWSDELAAIQAPPAALDETVIQSLLHAQEQARATTTKSKTIAQQILEEDSQEDDELFAMLADEISVPSWMTPILDQFPIPVRTTSPLSDISNSSRSSSSSDFSCIFTECASVESFSTSASYPTPNNNNNKVEAATQFKLSRRERARRARVFVDTSKTAVTPYDGGKTTVLTGGVMLGGSPKAPRLTQRPTQRAYNWHSASL